MGVVLTTSGAPIIGQVAWLLGKLMQGIYWVLDAISIPNVGIAIIIFTFILLMAMMPLQIKQQKFSKVQVIMQPEIQKIQNKYKGKKDPESQQRMMDETNAVYAKYGVSAMGSCVQLLIQMPVLFALYQVIYHIPGYITLIGDKISGIAENSAFVEVFSKFVTDQNAATLTRNYSSGDTKNIIDAVYGLTTRQWTSLLDLTKGESYFDELSGIHEYVHKATNFLSLNISDSPSEIIKTAFTDKPSLWFLIIIGAALFPILAWLTQWLTYKLMPQPSTGNDDSAMSGTMKSMNTIMPIMSAFFCLTLPVGVGIYWIMSAVIRAVQQVLINRKMNSLTEEDIVKEAQEKANAKRAKQGLPPQKITSQASVSTRNINVGGNPRTSQVQKAAQSKKNDDFSEYYNRTAKPGSLASKANMVKAFDESSGKNKKK